MFTVLLLLHVDSINNLKEFLYVLCRLFERFILTVSYDEVVQYFFIHF